MICNERNTMALPSRWVVLLLFVVVVVVVASFLPEQLQQPSRSSPCLSSCPSAICPPRCSLRDLCKMEIKPCYSSKRLLTTLNRNLMPSHHLRGPVWSESCLTPPITLSATLPFPTEHRGLPSVSVHTTAFPPRRFRQSLE